MTLNILHLKILAFGSYLSLTMERTSEEITIPDISVNGRHFHSGSLPQNDSPPASFIAQEDVCQWCREIFNRCVGDIGSSTGLTNNINKKLTVI